MSLNFQGRKYEFVILACISQDRSENVYFYSRGKTHYSQSLNQNSKMSMEHYTECAMTTIFITRPADHFCILSGSRWTSSSFREKSVIITDPTGLPFPPCLLHAIHQYYNVPWPSDFHKPDSVSVFVTVTISWVLVHIMSSCLPSVQYCCKTFSISKSYIAVAITESRLCSKSCRNLCYATAVRPTERLSVPVRFVSIRNQITLIMHAQKIQ